MKSMLILVPTRGRPDNAVRLEQRFYETRTSKHTWILFAIDEDDEQLSEYRSRLGLSMAVGERLRLGGTLNKYANLLCDEFDIIGFMGDDVYPQTIGWDYKIKKAMPDNGIVYCNDGWQGKNLPTAVFMDSHIIKRLGYMALPGMKHLFIDNYWWHLGTRLGTLTYLEDVYLEHLHPFAGKAEDDQTYREANSGARWVEDDLTLKSFMDTGGMDRAVERILE